MIASRLEGMVELQSQGTAPTASPGTTTNGAPMGHDEFPPLTSNASYLIEMVSDAIAYKPWETQPQAAVLAVASWLRSVGNYDSARKLEREATNCKK